MNARTISGLATVRVCSDLLHGRRLLLKLEGVVHSYVRPVMLYGSEAWCLGES